MLTNGHKFEIPQKLNAKTVEFFWAFSCRVVCFRGPTLSLNFIRVYSRGSRVKNPTPGFCSFLKVHQLDIAEPDGVSLGLQGDVAELQEKFRARRQELLHGL